MTIREIIKRVEKQFPHNYTDDVLLAWTNDLERDIAEVFTHFEDTKNYTFTNHTDIDENVQIDEPQIYVPYLISQICLANEEYDRYNNHAEIFQARYQDWKDKHIRKNKPVFKGTYRI